jgi:hemerythrin-like metal-binding protein
MADLIVWTNKYSVGCNYIDDQHKKLVQIINELNSAFLSSSERSIISKVLQELVDYTKYHFEAEEKLMEKYGYPNLENHKKIHKQFVDKVVEFSKRYELGDDVVGYDMLNYLKDWLLNHIMGTDTDYAKMICDKVD